MEAESVTELPRGAQWQYEPKWDGFRCLLIRDGRGVRMQSKSGRDLVRYFPEVASTASAISAGSYVLDGELIIQLDEGYSFDALLQRIHPAASRVKRLARETPARFIAFDLLRSGDVDVGALPLARRRPALEKFARRYFGGNDVFELSPATRNFAEAKRWLQHVEDGHDGVVAKRLDLAYLSGTRDGMQKIKLLRSADCVVGGFRYGEKKQDRRKVIGSLLLGLYDDAGRLHHVGFTSAIKVSDRPGLTDKFEKIVSKRSFTGKAPGGPSRWSTRRSAEWNPVRPVHVVEVCYDHVSGDRFRHGTKLLRWRPDKKPSQCRMEQLHQKSAKRLQARGAKPDER
ncbi:ATP-dependent DNA ligase [Bradyrhizobium sp. CB1717]|uniref:ATP-dependent DNA ligase n=1 Tax=Bradyrhizobium sp. CB1717 TaxID=3039154 RepID=UPI0024B14B86|nr:ATP-dependent DNA ligase [Bradyrhizobium sp. CB1717]WFU28859.1 ATP-dependent DNA ligase [Bradyrhizobium sp. CB1717]